MDSEYKFEEKKVGGTTLKVYVNRPKSIYEMFRGAVEQFPERLAIAYDGNRLTYSQLDKGVDSLASVLKEDRNVKKGDRIAIFLKNDDAFPLAFLAISKIGAISVVLNTILKASEAEYQLGVTEPVGAIVDDNSWSKNLDSLLGWKIEKSSLPEICDSGDTCSPEACDEEDVHTILFTSGTTGRPKGVRILHRNLIHSALRMEQDIDMMGIAVPPEGARTVVVAPLFHVMALQEQWLPSIRSGSIAILMDKLSVSPFLELAEREKVDYLVGTPALYRILLLREDIKNYDLSSVKLVGFGGAPMPPDLMQEMQQVFVNAKFFNGFGLTEASVSLANIDRECMEKPTSIGCPSLGCEVMIVDDNMKEMSPGEIGQIAVKGPNVVDGYYNNPEETKKAFKKGWFLTGDLGKMEADGYFYIAGRSKDMINRGGENVYPVEVEHVICLHPKVLEVAVYDVPDKVLGEKVAAAIIPVPGTNIDPEEIKEFCKDKLARFKIPEYVVLTASLPKNPGGKVIKEKLKEQLSDQIGK